MNVQEYIASGILELYVAGVLAEQENSTVAAAIVAHPEIKKEVLEIEKSITTLTAAVAVGQMTPKFNRLDTILKQGKVVKMDNNKSFRQWISYVGWAASIALLVGLWNQYNQKSALKYEISAQEAKNAILEEQIISIQEELKLSTELVTIFRDKNIEVINLSGQEVAPNTYAKAFWNTQDRVVYIDAAGLPAPPKGKVYQVWSLSLNPLTPTSLGLLENFQLDTNKVFSLSNVHTSEAFGITLEPDGGSKAPTMNQLYTLGVVKS